MTKDNWTREQTIVALDVYCRIPFRQVSGTNNMIVNAEKAIGRTLNAIRMKLENFGSLDPKLKEQGLGGLPNVSKLDKEIWAEYSNRWDQLSYDSAVIQAKLLNISMEKFCGTTFDKFSEREERETMIKQRVNQSFFRDAVLGAYNYKCCITGLSAIDLLEACHIMEWAVDKDNRANPENGLCLNTLFHRAYDKSLIGITPDYDICVSSNLLSMTTGEPVIANVFTHYNKRKITLPDHRYMPSKEFLEIRYQEYLKNNNG